MFFIIFFQESYTKRLKWCWTRPALNIEIKPNLIGYNWGVCEGEPIPKDGEEVKVD